MSRDVLVTKSGQTEGARSSWLGIIAIILVAIDLRPGIVSVGPVLNSIRDTFGLSHSMASLLTAIPDLMMGILALPTPWLAKRFGRDRSILAALGLLCTSIVLRSFSKTSTDLLLTTVGVGAGIAIAGALVAGFIKANFANCSSHHGNLCDLSFCRKHDIGRCNRTDGRSNRSRVEIWDGRLECLGNFSNCVLDGRHYSSSESCRAASIWQFQIFAMGYLWYGSLSCFTDPVPGASKSSRGA